MTLENESYGIFDDDGLSAKGYNLLTIVGIVFLLVFGGWMFCTARVEAGHRGVLLTFGAVEERSYPEGLMFKAPWQKMINMQTNLQVVDVEEHCATYDQQQVMTKLAVHYRVVPEDAWKVYQNMRERYAELLLIPVIQEDLKAITALYTSTELIQLRPQVVLDLEDKLEASMQGYSIEILTVNIVDFQFTDEYWEAIERKQIATQDAQTEKNKVEIARYEQLQKIITEEGQYNVTLIKANAEKIKKILEAEGDGEAIEIVAQKMRQNPEYMDYLLLSRWNGKLPSTMLSDNFSISMLLNTTTP